MDVYQEPGEVIRPRVVSRAPEKEVAHIPTRRKVDRRNGGEPVPSRHRATVNRVEFVMKDTIVAYADWSDTFEKPSDPPNLQLREEYSKLFGLVESCCFGEIAESECVSVSNYESLIWLTTNQFVWLFPIYLITAVSHPDDWECSQLVINKLRERFPSSKKWNTKNRLLQEETRRYLFRVSEKCCHAGWSDETRVRKRTETCWRILVDV